MFSFLATVSGFSVTQLNTTSVSVMWKSINTTGVSHYTVYYTSTCACKTETDSGSVTFPANTNQGVIGGLDPNLNYVFAISVTFNIGGTLYENNQTPYFKPSKIQYKISLIVYNFRNCTNILSVTIVVIK